MRVFLPAGTHLPWRVTGMGKFYTHWRVWVRMMGKIKEDGYGYGVVPPAPIPCGCHPYPNLPLDAPGLLHADESSWPYDSDAQVRVTRFTILLYIYIY
jgi:hypothetical protein